MMTTPYFEAGRYYTFRKTRHLMCTNAVRGDDRWEFTFDVLNVSPPLNWTVFITDAMADDEAYLSRLLKAFQEGV